MIRKRFRGCYVWFSVVSVVGTVWRGSALSAWLAFEVAGFSLTTRASEVSAGFPGLIDSGLLVSTDFHSSHPQGHEHLPRVMYPQVYSYSKITGDVSPSILVYEDNRRYVTQHTSKRR